MKETENVGFIDGNGQVFNLQDRPKFWKFDCDCGWWMQSHQWVNPVSSGTVVLCCWCNVSLVYLAGLFCVCRENYTCAVL